MGLLQWWEVQLLDCSEPQEVMTSLTGKTQCLSSSDLPRGRSHLGYFTRLRYLFVSVCVLRSCSCVSFCVPSSACPLLPCCFIHNCRGYFCVQRVCAQQWLGHVHPIPLQGLRRNVRSASSRWYVQMQQKLCKLKVFRELRTYIQHIVCRAVLTQLLALINTQHENIYIFGITSFLI